MILCFDESLREYFPERVEVHASSALDALRLIAEQHPLNGKVEPILVKFKDALTVTRDTKKLNPKEYSGGAGVSKATKNIVGGVLIVAGVVIMVVTGWTGVGLQVGLAFTTTGLSLILSPTPKLVENTNTKFGSYTFGAGANTTQVGTVIPLILGRCLASAQVLSLNISTDSTFNGIDDPDGSPYFKAKSDTNLPTINNNKFYGLIRAGDTTKILHQDNELYRTGTELQ